MQWLLCLAAGTVHALVVQEPRNVVFTPPRNGIFCRGNGCPYAETGTIGGQNILGHAGSEQDVKQQAEAALAMGMDALLARKEFCRGMSCVDGMGKPVDRTKAAFIAQCSHFFKVGGLEGHDDYRSVKNVYDSFGSICGPRVGYSEMPLCRAYGDVVAAALASQMESITVGSAEKICDSLFEFTLEVKQAQVDLELFEGSLGTANRSGLGPSSERGQRWAKQLELSAGPSAVQVSSEVHNSSTEDKYQITMPSWDGGLNATTVPAELFDHCELEMQEIMTGKSQTAGRISKLAVDWCNFQQLQGGRPDWTDRTCLGIGKLFALALRNIPDPPPPDQPALVLGGALPKPTFGQVSPTMPPTYTMMPTIPDPPKWGEPPVSGPAPMKMSKEQMKRMLDPVKRFLVRPDQVCQQLFVAIGATTRVEGLLRNSYKTSFRIPSPGMKLPGKDDAMLQAMQEATNFRKSTKQAPTPKTSEPQVTELVAEDLPKAADYNPKVISALG